MFVPWKRPPKEKKRVAIFVVGSVAGCVKVVTEVHWSSCVVCRQAVLEVVRRGVVSTLRTARNNVPRSLDVGNAATKARANISFASSELQPYAPNINVSGAQLR